jgi:hypothetical protein
MLVPPSQVICFLDGVDELQDLFLDRSKPSDFGILVATLPASSQYMNEAPQSTSAHLLV